MVENASLEAWWAKALTHLGGKYVHTSYRKTLRASPLSSYLFIFILTSGNSGPWDELPEKWTQARQRHTFQPAIQQAQWLASTLVEKCSLLCTSDLNSWRRNPQVVQQSKATSSYLASLKPYCFTTKNLLWFSKWHRDLILCMSNILC